MNFKKSYKTDVTSHKKNFNSWPNYKDNVFLFQSPESIKNTINIHAIPYHVSLECRRTLSVNMPFLRTQWGFFFTYS